MFITNVVLTQENAGKERRIYTGEGCEYRTECDTLENAKLSIKDVIWQSIELDGLTGYVNVSVSIENNGEYVDGEEFEILVEKVVFTEQPSRYVKWGNKVPHIFTVDRNNSVVINVDTGTMYKE